MFVGAVLVWEWISLGRFFWYPASTPDQWGFRGQSEQNNSINVIEGARTTARPLAHLGGCFRVGKRNGCADYNCTSVQIRNLFRTGIALPGFARKAAASNSGSSVSDMDDAASVGQSTADDTDYADAASDSSSANPFGDAAVTRNSVYQLVGRTLVGVHWPLAKFKKKFGKSGVRGLRFKWCGVEGVLLPFKQPAGAGMLNH